MMVPENVIYLEIFESRKYAIIKKQVLFEPVNISMQLFTNDLSST